jgi:hypothetical protein
MAVALVHRRLAEGVVTEPPAVAKSGVAVPSGSPNSPPAKRIATAAAALERNGIRPLLAPRRRRRGLVRSSSSTAPRYTATLPDTQAVGVADDIRRSGRYQPLRLRLYRMDRNAAARMRTLARRLTMSSAALR